MSDLALSIFSQGYEQGDDRGYPPIKYIQDSSITAAEHGIMTNYIYRSFLHYIKLLLYLAEYEAIQDLMLTANAAIKMSQSSVSTSIPDAQPDPFS